MKLAPDDPRLTAFALGELAGEEHARVAAAVAADPALQAAVDEINQAVTQLSAALATEPSPEMEPIALELPPEPRVRIPGPAAPRRARLFQFPYVAIGTLAAACFAVVLLLLNETPRPTESPSASLETEELESENSTTTLAESDVSGESPDPLDPLPTMTEPAVKPPLVAGGDREPLATTPTAPFTPPVPESDPSAEIAVVLAEPSLDAPAPGWTEVRQIQTADNDALAGIASGQRPNSSGAGEISPLPPPLVVEPGFLAPRTLAGHASLPSAPSSNTDHNSVTDHYEDILADNATTGDHLRLTFRDFGTARYPSRPSSTDVTRGAGDSLVLANRPDSTRETESDPAEVRRAREDNIKTMTPPRPRLPYEDVTTGNATIDEQQRRGTIERGGQLADLETQLRELAAEGDADSPVEDFVRDNPFVPVTENPASIFPVVVDAASHVNVRRALLDGALPAREDVRIEELINYHDFGDVAPADAAQPFAATLEVASAPWAPEHRLVRIGLRARQLSALEHPDASYVVLIETGERADDASRLGLIKEALRQFAEKLHPRDRIAIVVHSAQAALVLPSTPARERDTILTTIETIRASGHPAGTLGLKLAYDVARSNHVPGGINRVIYACDGDSRIGPAGRDAALQLINQQAAAGLTLSLLGFGVPEIRESMLDDLGHRGAGELAFIDHLRDAQRAWCDRADGRFATVAQNVKVQVEFNPARVQSWRLIGHEDRVFLREDFDRDTLTADAIGSGHAITALFEIVPTPADANEAMSPRGDPNAELLALKIRYTAPGEEAAQLQQFSLTDAGRDFDAASADFKFAAAVAGFGMILRDSPYKGSASFAEVATWARAGQGTDPTGTRAEFLDLVERAERIAR